MKNVTRASLAPIMAALAWFAFPSGTASAQEAAPKPEPAVAAPAVPAAPAEAEKPKDPVADALGYPPGLNAGTKLDLQWPVPAESKSVMEEFAYRQCRITKFD